MSWNATNIHKPGPGFKLSCSFHLPKTLGRFPIWMAQSDSTHVLVTFVRGFVFLRVGSWKKHLWQTWPLFKVWRDKWIWCSGSYRVTYSKRKSWCSNPFGLSQSYVAPKGWFLLVVLQQENGCFLVGFSISRWVQSPDVAPSKLLQITESLQICLCER